MAKNNNTIFYTPIGTAKFAWLRTPDTKFATDGKGKYKIRILLDDNEDNRAWANALIEQCKLDAKNDGKLLKKGFKSPIKFPEDIDEEEFVVQQGKERASYDEDHRGKIFFEASSSFAPGLIDSAKVELPEEINIMSGDTIKAKIQGNPYDTLSTGISLRLMMVQLIERKNATASSKTDGFDVIEGGFKVADTPETKAAALKKANFEQLMSDDPDLGFFQDLVKK